MLRRAFIERLEGGILLGLGDIAYNASRCYNVLSLSERVRCERHEGQSCEHEARHGAKCPILEDRTLVNRGVGFRDLVSCTIPSVLKGINNP